ncbi:MAG: sigma-54-dependent transcriptional regulator [Solitalea-like symbiont of Tyrophagus putrescentiae]
MKRILIIDDEINIGLLLERFLTKHNFDVTTATSGAKAESLLLKNEYDLIFCDYRLDDIDGRAMFEKIKKINPKALVIIITGYSDIRIAVEMIKNGAYNYITKPLYPDEILKEVDKAFEYIQNSNMLTVAKANLEYQGDTSKKSDSKTEAIAVLDTCNYIIGESESAKELYKQIKLVAPTNFSVILFGESGTGKESVANLIHINSKRKNKPFIALDCGSLSKELASSELFGHEKGAFTGAHNQKIGHFELANGGTIFLDEVANLSYDIQVSLLRVIQERKVKRIGSSKEIKLDVRIIVASNEDLWRKVSKGEFREDLYHRFNEFNINIPPLRSRGNDILIFANYFLQSTNKELNKNIPGFTDKVIEHFKNYFWAGNIRELKNVIRRACLLTPNGNFIEIESIPKELNHTARTSAISYIEPLDKHEINSDLKTISQEAELEIILETLRKVNFNKTKAAALLNIDRKTLYNKMKSLKIKQYL